MEKPVNVKQIESFLKNTNLPFCICGDPEETVSGFSSLPRYREGTITWINSSEKLSALPSHVSVCVVQEGVQMAANTQIISPKSKAVFFSILENFWGDGPDDNTPAIGSGTVIGPNVQLGDHVRIGCNCTIQSLSVIGEDGYGYAEDESHIKTMVKHFGGVSIGDNVFIGCHTNIARGTIDDTVIESGTKIAPDTTISHNDYIGKNASILCAKLYGSVVIGDNAYVSTCIVRNLVKVGSNAIVGMGSVVTKDIEDG